MPFSTTSPILWASLKQYLQAVQESGLEGIPQSMAGKSSGAASIAETSLALNPGTHGKPVTSGHESLEKLRKTLGECRRCKLGKFGAKPVVGSGNPHSRLVFMGDWPSADEERSGNPFEGEAGRVLVRLIAAMGLKLEEVYVCNMIKCRLPASRDPEADEISACLPHLLQEIQFINPEVIVGLGKFTVQTLLGAKEPITKLRGKFHDFHGIPLMPTHDPAYLHRNSSDSSLFWEAWDDMVQVLQLLKLPVPKKNRKK